MKRDMDLLRAVLLKAQDGDPNGPVPLYTPEAIKYHRALAIDANLLKGTVTKDFTTVTETAFVFVDDLTNEGHDFLDGIGSESNWAKVKAFLSDGGKQITIETVKFAVKQLFGANGS